jgi:hypothetical protein
LSAATAALTTLFVLWQSWQTRRNRSWLGFTQTAFNILMFYLPIPSPKISELRAIVYHAFFIRAKEKTWKDTTAHDKYNSCFAMFRPMSR